MFTFLVILIALIAIVLVFLILIQSGRGGGLAGIAAGGATTQILGARQAPDILEKSTWGFATAFIVLCILTNFAISDAETTESVIQQRAREGQTEETLPVVPPPANEGAPESAPPTQEQPAPQEDGQ